MSLSAVIQKLIDSPNCEHESLTNFINGEFTSSEEVIDSVNPATGKAWIKIPNANKNEVDSAVHAATTAFESWSKTSVQYRSNLLLKLAALLEKNLEGLAILESRDQGKPEKLAKMIDIPRCIHNFRFFATSILHHTSPSTIIDEPVRAVNYVKHDAIGVAGLISPWNLPLYLLSFKLAPALAIGNTVVCKPSELTSVTAWVLMHAFKEAGFPAGVVNMVIGTGPSAGEPLVLHPDVPLISFTGSTVVGKKIAEMGARFNKKVSLEMGGKNACIVFPSCNLDKHLATIARSCFINQGEICLCSSRIFVHENLYADFVDLLAEEAQKFSVGDPTTDVTLGAMNSQAHFNKVKSYLDLAKKEGVLRCGKTVKVDGPCKDGYFIAPTIVTDVADDSRCMTEEIFGPVVCVTPFETMEALHSYDCWTEHSWSFIDNYVENGISGIAEEVIIRANATPYGLSASIFTEDSGEMLHTANSLRVGTVWCNTWLTRDLNMPFGGTKESGMGREGATDSLHFFTEQKTICIRL